MVRIESVEEYRALIREMRNKQRKTESNCFLMEEQIKKYIQQGRFFCQSYTEGILFLVDELNFYTAYYLWNQGAAFEDFRQDKPLMLCEYDSSGRRKDYIHAIETKLFGSGFSLLKISEMAVLNTIHLSADEIALDRYKKAIRSFGLEIIECKETELKDKIISLWDRSLHVTDIVLDDRVFLQNDQMTVICLVDKNREVAATGSLYYQGKTCQFRHQVTAAQYRRMGLGEALEKVQVRRACEDGIKEISVFINEDNVASWRLHEKVGFQRSGKTSRQYVLDSIK